MAEYFNRYGQNCFAEVEPPDLIYKQQWPFGNWARIIQRKWIVTHEDLGRGKALGWYDNDTIEPLHHLAFKRIERIQRLCCKDNATTYLEVSKFFIRSYCDEVFRLKPDMGVMLLRRDPLQNARSYINRDKDFTLDGVMPYFKKACFPINMQKLSKFQLYLWQWVEIELRYQRFIETHGIRRHYELKTEDLNNPAAIEEFFRFFDIELKGRIEVIAPRNTNLSQGRAYTTVTAQDSRAFMEFLEMIPGPIMDRVSYIKDYIPNNGQDGSEQKRAS